MPFYEYQCGECGHRLEVLQKISDQPLAFCPQCNEASLKKLISAAAFRLKGSGWYETDFKHGDKKKEKTADKESNVKSESSDTSDKPSNKNGKTSQPDNQPGKGTSSKDTSSSQSASSAAN